MSDLNHLEKMGRELKCPICLGLLRSAASLGCNHVFCNSCIMESMKSISGCPVCKVPFSRREVCPAPHMDNLANIFRSMELTAGVSILPTQTTQLSKDSDENVRKKNGFSTSRPLAACRGKSKKRSSKKSKKKKAEANLKHSDPQPLTMLPFTVKKRVHVTPIPVIDTTPIRPEKGFKLGKNVFNVDKVLSREVGLNKDEKLISEINREPAFPPFFWLREESDHDGRDDHISEELMNEQLHTCSSASLCFSDIKDSYDKPPANTSLATKLDISKDFDSEMFEWTQRACSPELCFTPTKKQARDIQGQKVGSSKAINSDNCPAETYIELRKSTGGGQGTYKKKKSRSGRNKKRKHAKISKNRTSENGSDKTNHDIFVPPETKKLMEVNVDIEGDALMCSETKCSRNSTELSKSKRQDIKKLNQTSIVQIDDVAELHAKKFSDGGSQVHEKEHMLEAMTGLSQKDKVKDHKRKANKMIKKSKHGLSRKLELTKNSTYDGTYKLCNEAAINSVNFVKDKANDQLHFEIVLPGLLKQNSTDVCTELPKKVQKLINRLETHGEIKGIYATNIEGALEIAYDSLDAEQKLSNQVHVDSNQNFVIGASEKPPKEMYFTDASTNKSNKNKSDNGSTKISCAFCKLSTDSEVTGKMMHYFNGKPVDSDHVNGANIIHVHRCCAEWAPDVFFDDDVAINLSSEVARSKRIKCCCCGIRGAALGCFERSCRKSFHFTCAKLTKECRWDDGNFVMLCPTHSLLKLPHEKTKAELKKSRRMVKRETMTPTAPKSDHGNLAWKWPTGTSTKWVLCCSALTNSEKDIVSVFSKLSGISVSKTWSLKVTHVVASTDKNGACKRTLKFLMGILEGKWIVRVDWIKECMKAMGPVDEEMFEIRDDVHGATGGPLLGRTRVINKNPKLFNGYSFYFVGEFTPSYKGYLQDLVSAGGGSIIQRKPISRDHTSLDGLALCTTFIIYSIELPEKHDEEQADSIIKCRESEAKDIADACGAKAASNAWILDSIAACNLESLV